jgi:periplasmic protein TonB
MNFSQSPLNSGNRWIGLAFVVLLHAVLLYGLLTGLVQKAVNGVRPPVETVVIEEAPKTAIATPLSLPALPKMVAPPLPSMAPPDVKIAPPPPVPQPVVPVASPKAPAAPVEAAPAATGTAAPTGAAVSVAAAASSALNTVEKSSTSVAIGLVCATQVSPSMPQRAREEGISGSVKARATIQGGKVVAVEILSSQPRGLFEAAVRSAMLQYECKYSSDELKADQAFDFKVD